MNIDPTTLGIMATFAGFVLWLFRTGRTVGTTEGNVHATIASLQAEIAALKGKPDQTDVLIRLETTMVHMQRDMDDIKSWMGQIIRPQAPQHAFPGGFNGPPNWPPQRR